MKGETKETLKKLRLNVTPVDAINYCMDKLYQDKEHRIGDDVVKGLMFEDLISTLIMARNAIKNEI